MLTPLAFLQVGVDAVACVEGRLDAVAYPRAGSAAFFAPDFSLSTGRPWWFDAGLQSPRLLTRADWAARHPASSRRVAVNWRDPDEGRFRRAFDSLAGCLRAGSLRKGVPVTSMSASLSPEQAVSLFELLLARVPQLPPGVMAYGLFLPQGARTGGPEFLIGATPEILFELQDGRTLRTMAVAGTRPAEAAASALESSPKDRDEHQAVVEDLLGQLSEWGEARASSTEVRQFGQLAHLVADIQLQSRLPLDFEAVARRLHPTPALGVYPRNAVGASWLTSIDPGRDRQRFGAPFGLRWPSGAGRALVAIRNVQYAGGRLEIWAGCGVVAMSRYEDEWQEVLQKMQAVRALWAV
jgi:menaquinone-specific isochorismate synthase